MPSQRHQLPDDIDALKALVTEQAAQNARLQAEKQASDQENARLNARVLSLQEQLNLALARRYAASSEKLSPDQILLFDEAEADALAALEAAAEAEADIEVPAHTRKRYAPGLFSVYDEPFTHQHRPAFSQRAQAA